LFFSTLFLCLSKNREWEETETEKTVVGALILAAVAKIF